MAIHLRLSARLGCAASARPPLTVGLDGGFIHAKTRSPVVKAGSKS